MKNNREISQISLPEWQRRQCWDEAGRMLSSYREDAFGAWAAWYGYDDGGERAVKLSGECVALTQNGNIRHDGIAEAAFNHQHIRFGLQIRNNGSMP